MSNEQSPGALDAAVHSTSAPAFEPLVIASDRCSVLAMLTREADQHFGHSRLRVRNVHVTAMNSQMVLASATFTPLSTD
jgi:hypothetical protein